MIPPEKLLHISEGAEAIAEWLHIHIIKRIVTRFLARWRRGEKAILTAYDKYMIEAMTEAGTLQAEIVEEIATATKKQAQEVRDTLEEIGVETLAYDNETYHRAGILPDLPTGISQHTAAALTLTGEPYYTRLMQRNYEATMGEWKNFTRTMPNAAHQLYIQSCDEAYHQVQSGAVSYTAAYSEAINKAARVGVMITYPSGHKDTIETATLRAIRTGTAQMSEQISLTRSKEMGTALRLTSSHLGARPDHQLWQGEVFWVDWAKLAAFYPALADVPDPPPATDEQKVKYREFVTATGIGTVTGLAGANCRHTSSAYIEGISTNPFEKYDAKENKRLYDLTQEQRAMERAIRKQKRYVMGLYPAREEMPDQYEAAALKLEQMNNEYQQFCRENKLRPLSERLEVAQWTREQGKAAIRAAKAAKKRMEASGE